MKELINKIAIKHFPRKPNVNGPVIWDENESKRDKLIEDLTKLSDGIIDESQYTFTSGKIHNTGPR